jgi:uncharacterized small protein (DUF1192 family)
MRDEARRKALLENRLEEANTLAESKDNELDSLRAELLQEQQLRKAAETQAANLQRENDVLKSSVSQATDSDSAAGQRVAALEAEVQRLQSSGAAAAAQAEEVVGGLSSEIDSLKAEIASTKDRHAEELQ